MIGHHCPMNTETTESIARVIHHTIANARDRGLESLEQWKAAVDAVRTVGLDIDASRPSALLSG